MEKKKGVSNVTRRTWDRQYYEEQAQLRVANGHEQKEEKKQITSDRLEFQSAPEGAAGPNQRGARGAFLTAREKRVDLDSSIGSAKVLTADQVSQGSGFHCQVCDRSYKDSAAYLDHINGKLHQKRLGYTMHLERSTVNQVRNRLKKKRTLDAKPAASVSAVEEYESNLKLMQQERQDKKKLKLESKRQKNAHDISPDEEIMKIMGFGGFSNSKEKNNQSGSSNHDQEKDTVESTQHDEEVDNKYQEINEEEKKEAQDEEEAKEVPSSSSPTANKNILDEVPVDEDIMAQMMGFSSFG